MSKDSPHWIEQLLTIIPRDSVFLRVASRPSGIGEDSARVKADYLHRPGRDILGDLLQRESARVLGKAIPGPIGCGAVEQVYGGRGDIHKVL